tara:strand:+ start:10842 stop:11081 length:240 start_codon:yes stop_codon:yes gene_type:complete
MTKEFKYKYNKPITIEEAVAIEDFANHYSKEIIGQVKEVIAKEIEQSLVHESHCKGWEDLSVCDCIVKQAAKICRSLYV